MMPNLGQGGCMAIEDAFVLGRELSRIARDEAPADRQRRELPIALKRYNKNRVLRAAVQGMSRLSSAILFQYNHPVDLGRAAAPREHGAQVDHHADGAGFLQNSPSPPVRIPRLPGCTARPPAARRPLPRSLLPLRNHLPPRPSHPAPTRHQARALYKEMQESTPRQQFSPLGRADGP